MIGTDFKPSSGMGGEKPVNHRLTSSSAAASNFVEAWERMRLGTWVVDATYTRQTMDGRTLNGSVYEARRPSDHLRIALGSVDATLNGRQIACGSSPEGEQACREIASIRDPRTTAIAEIERLRRSVLGSGRYYDVATDASECFVLFPLVAVSEEQWGSGTRFCFDTPTGALRLSEIRREGVIDITTAVSIRPDPSDADFKIAEK